ncbi:hypothetical protein FRC11_008139 [Ceratobasidium sp. 423]|nr:hypothetical protein FRC11_008139 [Ceratobasidium sp. 423]
MAPEQLEADTVVVSLSADIFSWGMLALELMTGSKPWADVENEVAVIFWVIRGGRPDRPTAHSKRCKAPPMCVCLVGHDALWELIQRCWRSNPGERPNIAELCTALPTLRSVCHN